MITTEFLLGTEEKVKSLIWFQTDHFFGALTNLNEVIHQKSDPLMVKSL